VREYTEKEKISPKTLETAPVKVFQAGIDIICGANTASKTIR